MHAWGRARRGRAVGRDRVRLFTSRRERRIWACAAALVAVIFSTLGLSRALAGSFLARQFAEEAFTAGFAILLAGLLLAAVGWSTAARDIGTAVAAAGALAIAAARVTSAADRTHLIEYAALAALIHAALRERAARRGGLRAPSLAAMIATALVGLADESLQALFPARVFDPRDLLFNVLAAVLGTAGPSGARWTRRQARRYLAASSRAIRGARR